MLMLFVINVAIYSLPPLYIVTLHNRLRVTSFYCYIGLVLFLGGLAGAVYSFPFSSNVVISGGNIAYGAFMMSTVMLLIIERDISTFRNLIRLVITIDLFVFVGFNFMAWLLDSGSISNLFDIPSEIFVVSLWPLIAGGSLILSEILLLLFIFLKVRYHIYNIRALILIYTIVFIAILCLDGLLFPLLAFGVNPATVDVIFGGISGKVVTALCFSLPLIIFYFLSQKALIDFVESPINITNLFGVSKEQLISTLKQYEHSVEQLRQDNEELLLKAECDELTSLYNRRKFNSTFESEWSRCQRKGEQLTIVIGDIDFFKQYNDSYGHNQGDECLKKIAYLWRKVFQRSSDLSARIGGEEFAIILPYTKIEDAKSSLKQFLIKLNEQNIPHKSSPISSNVTMSIGIASCYPSTDSSAIDLFVSADENLYLAKQQGRNTVVAN